MSSLPSARTRARAAVAVSVVATLTAGPFAAPASAGHHRSAYTTNCPKPESLVSGTTWHSHRLKRGIVLREGQHRDSFAGSTGTVDLHVLTVNTQARHVHFHPVMRKLAMRTKLSDLAHGHAKLVAATNSGFFDFEYGTPLGPLVRNGNVLVASRTKQNVLGFDAGRITRAGSLTFTGTVTANGAKKDLNGINVLYPGSGLWMYTSSWGSQRIPLPRDAVGRYVSKGAVSSSANHYSYAPSHGYLLVARGSTATNWLESSIHSGDSISLSRTFATTTAKPLRQAFGVGNQIVADGVARTDLRCRRSYPQPARTAIGYADGGKKLIIAVIADHPGTSLHGLDANQTARVMHDLGARQAYLFDGSGSTELLARMPKNPGSFSLRNYPADGGPAYEREMPVGFGVFFS